MHPQAFAAAQRGYTFLKEQGPRFGLDVAKLNPDILNVGSGADCALCQTSGLGYWNAIMLLEGAYPVTTLGMTFDALLRLNVDYSLPHIWERQHGFLAHVGRPDTYDYDQLTEAWRAVIKADRD